ncbi:uncharacterized protein DS421_18g627000 [Arachis hypogaea]|nr:uncharacterized protein DS421_18g627000 [Arachis hypogaea]
MGERGSGIGVGSIMIGEQVFDGEAFNYILVQKSKVVGGACNGYWLSTEGDGGWQLEGRGRRKEREEEGG